MTVKKQVREHAPWFVGCAEADNFIGEGAGAALEASCCSAVSTTSYGVGAGL